MNHNNSVVRRNDEPKRALKLPREPVGPSTTSLPNNIDFLLSFAICSNVARALSFCPLVT